MGRRLRSPSSAVQSDYSLGRDPAPPQVKQRMRTLRLPWVQCFTGPLPRFLSCECEGLHMRSSAPFTALVCHSFFFLSWCGFTLELQLTTPISPCPLLGPFTTSEMTRCFYMELTNDPLPRVQKSQTRHQDRTVIITPGLGTHPVSRRIYPEPPPSPVALRKISDSMTMGMEAQNLLLGTMPQARN